MKVECYRNNKKILDIELSIAEETLIKQLERGTLVYHTGKCIEIINLRSFDKIDVYGMSLENELKIK